MADMEAIRRALLIEAEAREQSAQHDENITGDDVDWLEDRASYLRDLADEIEEPK